MDIQGFVSSLRSAHLSPRTIDAYRREAEHFRSFIRSNGIRINQITPKVIMRYLEQKDAASERPCTTQRRLSALSSYFDYISLTTDGRIRNPVAGLRRPRRQAPTPKAVSDEILDALLAGISSARDRAIILTFVSSGLRLSELVSLDKDSLRVESLPQGQKVRVLGVGRVIGKGNKEREFLVDHETLNQIRAYLSERGKDDNPALFISNRKKRISPRAIEHMLRTWCKKLGLPGLHPHALRHSASSLWKRLGMDIYQICRLLGHNSVATTEMYVKLDEATLRQQYFACMEQVADRADTADNRPGESK
jgi:site-specific recombinase XerC